MDSYRDFPSDFEPAQEGAEEADQEQSTTVEIGTDERRMHVRAYNYWVSLLDGRDYPSIEDLEPGDLKDFAPNSVLLDFTSGRDDPATPYIGEAIREECGLEEEVRTIADVPSRSLLSRLTDHYMQIIANRAPVGFEAEFENQRDETICYRGILMPFSSDGDTIDFIYGVINWKKAADNTAQAEPTETAETVAPAQPQQAIEQPGDLDDESPEMVVPFAEPEQAAEPAQDFGEDMVPFAEPEEDERRAPEMEIAGFEIGEDAGLADRLWAAREKAGAVKEAEGRSREALYRALASAYDFALASKDSPEDYSELLEESGVSAQARAPMTPVVKLVFGIDYDKARLTEYSAALSYAERQQVEAGGFLALIEAQAGGLKALVAAERQARRPGPRLDTKTERAREQLRASSPISLADISGDEEFALVLTRRSGDGSHQPVALVDDPALVERAIRRAGA